MAQASVVLFWFSLALYIAATVLYSYQFVLKRSKVGWWARFMTGAGFICQTLSIGAHSISTGGTQLNGPNQLMLASWALVLLYFVMEHLIKIKIYGTFLIPVAVVFMGAAQLMGGLMEPAQLTEVQAMQLDSWRVTFHVALIVFANAGFAFGAVSAGIFLFQEGKLKSHTSNIVTRRLPSLSTLQMMARRAIAFSFPVYTAGLLLGILRAVELDVDGWWLDPRIMLSGFVWLLFGIYLMLVYRGSVSSRVTSRVALLGFVLVVALAIIARTVPVGFHIFGR
ncbi:MAG: cytochrome c biogenesis protein CcsA [Coriobacteriia bacterium]|nr:cytochrome c biogenesis protein CcsA [Coriobacteriia bacterium]